MAQLVEGGNFGGNMFSKLKALQNGGSLSTNEMDEDDANQNDAINTSQGMMGTVQGPTGAALSQLAGNAIDESIPLAQRIQQAAANSAVKVIPTAEQVANDAIQQQYANAPKNFFENAQNKATELGVGASPAEQAAMQAQKAATQTMIQNRNMQQFNNLRGLFGR
jgi:hypothetical protein